MKVICSKNNHGDLCRDCKHSIPHEYLPTCLGARCITYALEFAHQQGGCSTCSFNDECVQYDKGNGVSLNLFKTGEDCRQYMRKVVFARCVEYAA